MKPEIIARGWIWERSNKETAWKLYRCSGCRNYFVYPSNLKVLQCKKCKDWIVVDHGYVRKVREVK